jgi:hypothetical protein
VNKYKYEDLEKLMKKLAQHSKKGDIEISIEQRTGALSVNYVSNLETETVIQIYPSDINKFITIREEKWL